MKIIYMPHITRKYVRDHPKLLFVFGDNDTRSGFGGLAKEVRGEPNSVGIRVKSCPSLYDNSFYTDDDFSDQSLKIEFDIAEVKFRSKNYDAIVFPESGIGTGLADLKNRSPKTWEYLNELLVEELGIKNGVYNMRHPSWQYIIDWTSRMVYKYGGTVYEKDGKQWDWGQALCRETYGRNWMIDEEFNKNEEISPEEPAPERFVEDAKKWEKGEHPDWVDISRFKVRKE